MSTIIIFCNCIYCEFYDESATEECQSCVEFNEYCNAIEEQEIASMYESVEDLGPFVE